QALGPERDRADALARGLLSVREALDVSVKGSAPSSVAAQDRRAAVQEAHDRSLPGPFDSDRSEPAVASPTRTTALDVGSANANAVPATNNESRQTTGEEVLSYAAEGTPPANGSYESSSEARLLNRADILISRGDI